MDTAGVEADGVLALDRALEDGVAEKDPVGAVVDVPPERELVAPVGERAGAVERLEAAALQRDPWVSAAADDPPELPPDRFASDRFRRAIREAVAAAL